MKSFETPTPEIVDKAVANMIHLEQQRHFFARLQNPAWLQPLREKGFFSTPPSPKRDQAKGTIEVQFWPAAEYLSRMAIHAPQLVCDILLGVPTTENPFVVREILRAAIAMPAETAVRLASRITDLIKTPFLFNGELVGKFAVHLARGQEHRAALTLLRSALEVVRDPRPIPEELKSFDPHYRFEPRTRMRVWEYQQILQSNALELTGLLGTSFLELLCDLLEHALSLEVRRDRGQTKIEDYSYIWRPNIESGDGLESPKRILSSSVLESADRLASSGTEVFEQVQDILASTRYTVFERIAMHLIWRHPELAGKSIAAKLADKALFENIGVRAEYYALSEKAFGLLTMPQQDQILGWIQDGPDVAVLQKRGVSPEDVAVFVDQWRLEKLAPLREYLSGTWKALYESLEQRLGPPAATRNPISRVSAYSLVSKSPKTRQELETLPIREALQYIKSWKAVEESVGPFGTSEEGLGAVLSSMVETRSAEFSEQILELVGADPTYVRSALQGFQNGIRNGKEISWEPVLQLCAWVLAQPIEIPGRTGGMDTKDPDWTWTRRAIVTLVEEGLKKRIIPFQAREKVWEVLAALAQSEIADDDLSYKNAESEERDIWSASINRVRPLTIRCVILYVQWCKDNLGVEEFSLDCAPEAGALLEKHLNPVTDPGLDVRLIYGDQLAILAHIDETWVTNNVSRIFPDTPELKPLRDVAWIAYLTDNPAYDKMLEMLHTMYSTAVNEIGTSRTVGRGELLKAGDDNLGFHLMQFYWRGRIGLEDGTIVQEFFKRADDSLAAHVIEYVGRSLAQTKDAIPAEILNRLKSLWDDRLVKAAEGKRTREMAAFGWWFTSNYFDDEWALEHLFKSLQLSKGAMEPKLGALARLAALSDKYPSTVLSCTQMIVNTEREDVVLWEEDLSRILSTVLKVGDTQVSTSARQLINSLGMRGHHQYRGLLE